MRGFLARLLSAVEGVGIAIDAIRGNKMRASLTIMGVGVGVFVVVLIASAVHGINRSVAAEFESAGPSTFFLTRYPISFESCDGTANTCKWLSNPPIRPAEVAALRQLPEIQAAGMRLDWSVDVTYRGTRLQSSSIEAYTADWPELSAPDVWPGRAFTPAEADGAARVAVINTIMAERLFGDTDPLDREVLLKGTPFRVIGVYKDVASFLTGGDRPKAVVPLASAVRHLGARMHNVGVAIKPRPGADRDAVVDLVTATLRGVRGQRPAEESSFAIITQDKLFETYNSIVGVFFLVMIALSAVGLLVGGVGVVAIMMISVTERTREIGVRKALGATRTVILWQFLVEAITLTGIGVVTGLVTGWGGAALIRSATPIAASVPPLAVVAALAASVLTGVLFGMLPALRASRLDPVVALRHE
jgi:putative ABC transport system permease protein